MNISAQVRVTTQLQHSSDKRKVPGTSGRGARGSCQLQRYADVFDAVCSDGRDFTDKSTGIIEDLASTCCRWVG